MRNIVEKRECWNVEGLVKCRECISLCKIGLVIGRCMFEGCWWCKVVDSFLIINDLVGVMKFLSLCI